MHSVVMEVQLRELGWKIKSRGLLKGKVTFFRDVFHVKNPSLVDLLLLTENMGKARIHILSRGVQNIRVAPIQVIPHTFSAQLCC